MNSLDCCIQFLTQENKGKLIEVKLLFKAKFMSLCGSKTSISNGQHLIHLQHSRFDWLCIVKIYEASKSTKICIIWWL